MDSGIPNGSQNNVYPMGDNNSTNEVTSQVKDTKENKEEDELSMYQYKKNKLDTQGVPGQLYESKLNSIVLHRLLMDPKIKHFYLGSNLMDIGVMDDVCIRLTHEDCEKQLVILIQAKHKDNLNKGIYDDELYRSSSDFCLSKGFSSFIEVKKKFSKIEDDVQGHGHCVTKPHKKNKDLKKKEEDDVMYLGKLEDVVPHFIFYTTAVNNTMSSKRIKEPNENNPTINIVKNLINSRKLDEKVFQLQITEDDLKNVTKNYKTGSRADAEQFFEHLYFFTDQAQQEEVGRELEKEIAINQRLEASLLQVRSDIVFLNFYSKVHKWWLSKGKAVYLTKKCDYLHSILSDAVINAYLRLLHYNCVSYLELYSIQFNAGSMTYIQKELLQEFKFEPKPTKANVFMIKTNSVVLTSIKLKDCLSYAKYYERCTYLDYSYLTKMAKIGFEILLGEIKTTGIDILVIILDTTRQVDNERLINILNAFHKNIVIVTEESQTVDIGNSHDINVVDDYIFGLVDILNEEFFLKYTISVQGEDMDLSKIIDGKSEYSIINSDIILKVLNHEEIQLGRNLSNNHKIKDWYQERTVVLNKIENNEIIKAKEYSELHTLNDIDEKIVVITAEPGMGKSTLLSLLSAETKCLDPKTWIIQINLEDYSEDFCKWKENRLDIGLRESMLLACKAELIEIINDPIDLQLIEDGDLKLINKTLRGASLLLLELVVNCFNKGRIIFIFDGFDKMCPHYEKLTAKFIKNLISVPSNNRNEKHVSRNRVWITSRPYNSVKRTLHAELAEPFSLAPLSEPQQKDFYKKYWQANMNKKHLAINESNKQEIWTNISKFLKNVFQSIQFPSISSIPLQVIYDTAREYLQEEFEYIETENNTAYNKTFYPRDKKEEALHLSGIPLHMKIYASHFVKCFLNSVQLTKYSKNELQNPENWDFKVNTFEFFEKLHESKLFKEFHKGKNPYYPDCRLRYNNEKIKSIKRHKILAFFSLFDELLKTHKKLIIIEGGERVYAIQEFDSMIKYIEDGNENVGLIDGMRRKVPRFVHQALAECYAVEYFADLLKSFKKKPFVDGLAINFLINYLLYNKVGLMTFFNQKLKDDKDLVEVLSTNNTKNRIFDALMNQHENKIKTLHSVLDNGFKETAWILVQSIGSNIDGGNISNIIEYIGENFFIYAASFNYTDLLKYVLCKIREVNSLLIDDISNNIKRELNVINITNKDFIVDILYKVGLKDMATYFTHVEYFA